MMNSRERFEQQRWAQLSSRFLVPRRVEQFAGGEDALAELFAGRLDTFLRELGETYDIGLTSHGIWALERDQSANAMIQLSRRHADDAPSADLIEYELASYCLKRGLFPFAPPFQEQIPDDEPLLVLHRKIADLLAAWPEISRELDFEFYEARRARQLSMLMAEVHSLRQRTAFRG